LKRYIIIFLTLSLALSFTACAKDITSNPPLTETPPIIDEEEPIDVDQATSPENEASKPPFEGKILIITHDIHINKNAFYSAYQLAEAYGKDKVIHTVWPANFMNEAGLLENHLMRFASDPEIKAIIITTAYYGINAINAAIEKFRETRKDVYISYCSYFGSAYPQTVDLILAKDDSNMYTAVVHQAHKLGAEKFVYYISEYRMELPYNIKTLESMRQTCKELGMEFIDLIYAVDHNEEADFICNDIPKMVEKHGKNTAFFSASWSDYLLDAVAQTGAIAPQFSWSSFFEVLRVVQVFNEGDYAPTYQNVHANIFSGIHKGLLEYFNTNDIKDVMGKPYPSYSETLSSLAQQYLAPSWRNPHDMRGRLSAWPVDENFMYTITATEYAVKWINGEVPKEGVDVEVLKQLMEDFAGVEVWLTPFVDDGTYENLEKTEPTGKTYDNFLMMRMDYITF
jgi:hypothetical protein